MMVRCIVTLSALLICATLALAEEENSQTESPHQGIFQRITHVFHKDRANQPSQDHGKPKRDGLELKITVSPDPLKLSEAHKIDVMLQLTNHSRKVAQLDFPTTQRFEVLLRTDSGKLVSQWSEDQSFANESSYVTINPHEHVEYTATISGRDLVAGKKYTVEGFLPNYDNLRASKTIIPVR